MQSALDYHTAGLKKIGIMDFSFDIRGYFKPYGKNTIADHQLKSGFVEPFDENSSRKKLYEGYLKYNDDLKSLLKIRLDLLAKLV